MGVTTRRLAIAAVGASGLLIAVIATILAAGMIAATGAQQALQGAVAALPAADGPVTVEAKTEPSGGSAVLVSYTVTAQRGHFAPGLRVRGTESDSPFLSSDAAEVATGDPLRVTRRTGLLVNGQPAEFDAPLTLVGDTATVSYIAASTDSETVVWIDTPFYGTRGTALTLTAEGDPASCLIGLPRSTSVRLEPCSTTSQVAVTLAGTDDELNPLTEIRPRARLRYLAPS